ncbi:Arm DNA-binding domain-containing protein [Aidingimonas lacisalsi]
MYVRIRPSGNKSWELRYKRADGQWRWKKLGTFPHPASSY